MSNRVTFHRLNPTEKNPYTVFVAMQMDSTEGVWRRQLRGKHAGAELHSRPMKDFEVKEEEAITRLHFYRYSCWEDLIKDEMLLTEDRKHCEKLIEVSGLDKALDDILTTEYLSVEQKIN